MSDDTAPRSGVRKIPDSGEVIWEKADTPELYEFGPFHLDLAERRLMRGNEKVELTPKAFDTLVLLVRNSGHLLEKEKFFSMLWPDSFVEEGSLSNNIFLLRRALGEDPVFIETVPRRGYRFVGAVRQLPHAAPAQLQETPPGRPELTMEGGKRGTFRSRKLLFAGIAAALLLLLAGGIILRRFVGANSVPARIPQRLGIERRLTANPRTFRSGMRWFLPTESTSPTLIQPDSICARFPVVKRAPGPCQKALLRGRTVGSRTTHTSW